VKTQGPEKRKQQKRANANNKTQVRSHVCGPATWHVAMRTAGQDVDGRSDGQRPFHTCLSAETPAPYHLSDVFFLQAPVWTTIDRHESGSIYLPPICFR
jgi:hypothetical protein